MPPQEEPLPLRATLGDAMDGNTSSDSLSADGALTVNHEYARRYEHNQRRAELHRCWWPISAHVEGGLTLFPVQEKFGSFRSLRAGAAARFPKTSSAHLSDRETDSVEDTDDCEEDETGELGSETLDAQVYATIQAIKSKDPRVYDASVDFYSEPTATTLPANGHDKAKDKPISLSEYQRSLLLQADPGVEADHGEDTFVHRQQVLKATVSKAIRDATEETAGLLLDAKNDREDPFWNVASLDDDVSPGPAALSEALTRSQVEAAEDDPDSFLSKYLTSRAWVPSASSRPEAFLSDDEEHEEKAEEFEEAYNLRFEDPDRSNRKLVLHSRAAAATKSVRQHVSGKRKRAREDEKAQKSARRSLHEQERARLKELKLEETSRRVIEIQTAAGLRGLRLSVEEWSNFLSTGWEDGQWQTFMKDKFGEQYYATTENDDTGSPSQEASRYPRKPKWSEEIDVSDLLEGTTSTDKQSGAPLNRSKAIPRRRDFAAAVEQRLKLDAPSHSSSKTGRFRYRETSPTNFGLTTEDILLASDSQLNQYVGLKKLASFRDPARKKRDKKRLGKKARLRQWRTDTFGPIDSSRGR